MREVSITLAIPTLTLQCLLTHLHKSRDGLLCAGGNFQRSYSINCILNFGMYSKLYFCLGHPGPRHFSYVLLEKSIGSLGKLCSCGAVTKSFGGGSWSFWGGGGGGGGLPPAPHTG